MESREPVKVLTIAGSDSGGAAGLQADLKTFTALGAYGMSAVTVVTAQNSERVVALQVMPETLVAAQIGAVLQDYGAAAIKTGFLGSATLVETVATSLDPFRRGRELRLVVDPVLVNHRGEALFGEEVTEAYRQYLLPGCTLLTPNVREAALLCGQQVKTWTEVGEAAEMLQRMGAKGVLISGVWRDGLFGDALCDGREVSFLRTPHVETKNTHGSGDTLSAAIAVFLARGQPLRDAARQAQAYSSAAIRGAMQWRMGKGHGPLNHLAPWPDKD